MVSLRRRSAPSKKAARQSRTALAALTAKAQMKAQMKRERSVENSMRLREMRRQNQQRQNEERAEEERIKHIAWEEVHNETKQKAFEWKERMEKLVDMEWEIESDMAQQRLTKWSVARLVSQGLAVVGLRAKRVGTYFGDMQVSFSREGGAYLTENEFQRGDEVVLTVDTPKTLKTGDAAEDEAFDGVVMDGENELRRAQVLAVSNTSITCAVKCVVDESQVWRLDRGANKIMHERTVEGLGVFAGDSFPSEDVRRVLMGVKIEDSNLLDAETPELDTSSFTLNDSQVAAISSIATKRITVIQGPPGCGKTYTSCALLAAACKTAKTEDSYYARKGRPLLATADSHVAVDQMCAGLIKLGVNAVRLGAAANVVDEAVQKASVHVMMEKHARFQELEELREQVFTQSRDIPKLRREAQAFRRLQAKQEAENVKNGVVAKELAPGEKRQADPEAPDVKFIRAMDKLPELRREAYDLEMLLSSELISNADVVCTTLAGCGGRALSRMTFDVIVLDEATQSTEPRAVIAVNKLSPGGRLVLVGDQQQLPPVCVSQEANAMGLGVSMFERLIAHPLMTPNMLQVQFRMHPLISAWPSQTFYEGKLMDGVTEADRVPVDGFDWPSAGGVAFIHTTGTEQTGPDGTSYLNREECEIVQEVVQSLRKHVPAKDIGVIAPYQAQVSLLKGAFRNAVEVKTVDGYQGREKSIIILSCVRSNSTGTMGFLADYRRLNVALTRAQRGLIVIGNPETLRNNKYWSSWLDFVKERNLEVEWKRQPITTRLAAGPSSGPRTAGPSSGPSSAPVREQIMA